MMVVRLNEKSIRMAMIASMIILYLLLKQSKTKGIINNKGNEAVSPPPNDSLSKREDSTIFLATETRKVMI